MNYIVLDLEWNQPISYQSPAYRRIGEKLLFEVIQIGAVKLNDKTELVDVFDKLVCPQYYRRLHPRIRKITGISQEDLLEADTFADVYNDFLTFCGEDYAIFTWGGDDLSVLEQNRRFYKCDRTPGAIYDLQYVYGDAIGQTKNRVALHTALEQCEIEPDESMPFHNAKNDAYYTSLLLKRLIGQETLLAHPVTARELVHTPREKEKRVLISRRYSLPVMLTKEAARFPKCPVCGRKTDLLEEYLHLSDTRYRGLFSCRDHGLIIVTLERTLMEDGKKGVFQSAKVSEEQSAPYVNTKRLQWRNKLAAHAAAAAGRKKRPVKKEADKNDHPVSESDNQS